MCKQWAYGAFKVMTSLIDRNIRMINKSGLDAVPPFNSQLKIWKEK
jgi:hypothetical protein